MPMMSILNRVTLSILSTFILNTGKKFREGQSRRSSIMDLVLGLIVDFIGRYMLRSPESASEI